LSMKIKIKST